MSTSFKGNIIGNTLQVLLRLNDFITSNNESLGSLIVTGLCLYFICCIFYEKTVYQLISKVLTQLYELYLKLCFKLRLFYVVFIPSELHSAWNQFNYYIIPYLSFLREASLKDIMKMIYKTAETQVIPLIPGSHITQDSYDIICDSSRYSLMATAVYCDHLKMDLLTHFYNYNFWSLLQKRTKHELYKQYFASYSHIQYEDVLWLNSDFPYLRLSHDVKAHAPTVCICKDTIKQTICVIIKGTSSLNDILLDLAVEPIQTRQGFIHEGAGKCALMLIQSKEFNSVLQSALDENPGYSITTIGHSLGASIASFLCIFWRKYNMYSNYPSKCIGFASFPCISKDFQDKGLDYIHIFVNEDDNVPRFNSDHGYLLSQHMRICYNNRNQHFDKLKTSIDEYHRNYSQYYDITEQKPLNFILPGTIYYMNPCLFNDKLYYEYENSKLFIYHHFFLYLLSKLLCNIGSMHSKPSCKIFSGEQFPKSVRFHPWFMNHHAAENYEIAIANIKLVLEQNK